MTEQEKKCPECEAMDGVDRRHFLTMVGGTAVTLASLEAVPQAAKMLGAQQPPQPGQQAGSSKPAEALIRELYQGLSAEQRRQVVMPWDHVAPNQTIPTRKRMYNASINQHRIGTTYTRPQQELVGRILRSISSDEEGYTRLTRNGTYDGSGSFGNCGAHIFGDPTGNQQFAWVFTGHHLTVRCDGNSEPDAAFGGPMYYGHSPDGFSPRNIFNFQTRTVLQVYDALSEQQRRRAIIATNPGEHEASVRFRNEGYPGIPGSDLTPDQRSLVQQVMRDLLSPYRREDADEVMDIVRRNGGMERIHLGFFRGANTPNSRWDFWRLEGPGFVWNFRVLPHVHCYVNIAVPAARG
jgi:hypothetical protein